MRAHVCVCVCLYMSHVCRFRFPQGIRAISTAPSCHAGTIELLRLIAPTSLSRPIVVVLIIVLRSIFFFLRNTLSVWRAFTFRRYTTKTTLSCARELCALFEFLEFRLIELCELEDDCSTSMMGSRGEHVLRIGANPNCRLDLSL